MKHSIAIVGCGKLGQACGEVLAEKHHVKGFDLQARRPVNFSMAENLKDAIKDVDYVLIAVPTPHEDGYGGETPTSHLPEKDFNYSPLTEVIKLCGSMLYPNQVVVVVSTVLPGTVRKKLKQFVRNNELIYNPYLIAMGSVKWDMRNPEMIIIGSENGQKTKAVDELVEIYKSCMDIPPRLAFGTWEEAEAIKIFYNTFISAKISLVNMILDVAERCGNMNVDVVTKALRDSNQRIMGPRYMHAGMGDAGACHPRDNIALRYLSKQLNLGYDLFGTIMEAREKQAKNLALRAVEIAENSQLPIVIHGKAYKPLVPYLDGSYSLLIAHYIRELGKSCEFVDPMTGDFRSSVGPAVFLLAHDAGITYSGTGLNSGTEQGCYCNFPPGSILLDPWRTAPSTNGVEVIKYGNSRRE